MRSLQLAGLMLILSACVRSHVPPEDRIFPSGRYSYDARLLLPGAPDSVDFHGALDIHLVTPDSLAGRWEVPGYDAAVREGRFNVVTYEVHARVGAGPDTLTVIHDLDHRGRTGAPACSVRVVRTGYFSRGRCTLHPPYRRRG